MNEKEQNKFIAIIKDGYSDYLVIKKFISSIFEYHNSLSIDEKFFFDMGGLNIHDAMARYVNILKGRGKEEYL